MNVSYSDSLSLETLYQNVSPGKREDVSLFTVQLLHMVLCVPRVYQIKSDKGVQDNLVLNSSLSDPKIKN